jgi:hypothetical protein
MRAAPVPALFSFDSVLVSLEPAPSVWRVLQLARRCAPLGVSERERERERERAGDVACDVKEGALQLRCCTVQVRVDHRPQEPEGRDNG